MRALLAAALLGLSLTPACPAEKPAHPKEAPALPARPEGYVKELETLLAEEEDAPPPDSAREALAMWKKRLERVDTLVAEFRKKYADSPLRWDVLYWEANASDVRDALGMPGASAVRPAAEVYAEILAAPDASAAVRAKASEGRLMVSSSDVEDKKLPLADWEKMLAEHCAKFPDNPHNAMLQEQRVGLVRELEPARLVPVLEALAKDPVADVAAMAQRELASAKRMEALKTSPIDLKFTALDGAEVDLAKLRGKVVLVQFWASWCQPCMEEMPKVVAAYGKWHAQGLQIIGISLDEEEKAARGALKKNKVAWPQFFDGKGWENALAKQYGIEQIPTLWLVDKKGMVVDFSAGEDLEEKVAKLLAE